MRSALEAVLEKSRPGFQADGSDIHLGEGLMASVLKQEFQTVSRAERS